MTATDLNKPIARRQLIRRLIATGEIHSQEQVVEELARRGVNVTQATVSRDFAELGIVRGVRGALRSTSRRTTCRPRAIRAPPIGCAGCCSTCR
jgi:hypothetical protein